MVQNIISCAIHDYIEIACLYKFEIKITLTDNTFRQGIAKTTQTDSDKKEYLLIDCQQQIQQIELVNIKKMTAIQPNPHFNSIVF